MSTEHLSVYEFFEKFPNEQSAFTYLESRRWPDGIDCPDCGSLNIRNEPDYRYHFCRDCYKKFTVRSNTIFERSHIPLHKWLFAVYLMQTSRKGINSIQLSKELGITQKAAWFLLHRLRTACDDFPTKLTGTVEVDETYIGGRLRNKRANKRVKGPRGTYGKHPLLGMRERDGDVVLKSIPDTQAYTLGRSLGRTVAQGSTVYTDEHAGYRHLDVVYTHETVSHGKKEWARGEVCTNGIESVWAIVKRAYMGIYHHFLVKHLQRYANEVAFRLNNRQGVMEAIDALVDRSFGIRLTFRQLVA